MAANETLTEEELDIAQELADQGVPESPRVTRRLIAEVRRLRSDEWLSKAAEEIATNIDRGRKLSGFTVQPNAAFEAKMGDDVLAILRKHRDGKA